MKYNDIILSIIIVNWNTKDHLENCLKSIYENTKNITFEIIVVDNASSDGSVEMVRSKFPYVTLIENKENLGFGAANNQGIKTSKGKYILILNPDTVILPGCLDRLMGFLGQYSDVGAVGPKILNPDKTIQITCARNFPTLLTEFFWLTTLVRRFPKNRVIGYYLMSYWDHDDRREVNCLSGACMMVRKDVLEKLELFDEDYFMYGEDVDLCYRIKKASWQIWYLSEAQIIHYGGASSKKISESAAIYDRKAIQLFFRKHYGKLVTGLYRLMCFFISFGMVLSSGLILLFPFIKQRLKVKKIFLENKAILLWALKLKGR